MNAIGTKWVYKIKRKSNGRLIDRYKARLIAKGYAKRYCIDYEETLAPTSRMTTIRIGCPKRLESASVGHKKSFLNVICKKRFM